MLAAASAAHEAPWAGEPAPAAWNQPARHVPALLPAAHADHPDLGACQHIQGQPAWTERVSSISFTSPNGTYFAGDTIHIRVDVTDGFETGGNSNRHLSHTSLALETGAIDRHAVYEGDSRVYGSSYVLYNYTVQPGDFSTDLDYSSTVALRWSGYLISDSGGSPYGCELPAPGGAGSLAAQGSIKVFGTTASTVAISDTPDGLYGEGREIVIAVLFPEAASFSGEPPALALNVSGARATAAYKSGNGTATFLFGYVVQPGDATGDLDYYATDSLTGAITNGTGQPVGRTLPAPGAALSLSNLSGVAIDSAAPPLIAGEWATDGTDDFLALGTATDIDAISAGGRTYAVVSAAVDDAVQLIRVHGNGTLHPADEVRDAARLDYAYGVDAFRMGGAAYAIAAAHGGDGVQLLRIHDNNDTLSEAGWLPDNATRELDGVTRATAFEMGGAAYALATGFSDHGIELVRIGADGSMEGVGRLPDSPALELENAFDAAVFDLGGAKHALVTGYEDDGIQLVRIDADGTLAAVNRLEDNSTLELDGPRGVAAFDLGGAKHALVASEDDDGIQLVRIGADGSLAAVASATDGDPGFAELDGATGVAVFAGASGETLALVASRWDDGIQLVSIGADGSLSHAESATDGDPGFAELDGAGGAAAFSVDGVRYAAVSSIEGSGVQFMRLSGASVVNVTSTAADGTYAPGDEIDIAVAFSHPVNVSGAVELRLNSGGAAGYRSGSGTAELAFRYVVGPDDGAADLDYAGAGALSGAGSVRDAAIPDLLVGRELPAAGTGRSLGDLKDIAVGRPAAVESVSSPDAAGTYGPGETIRVNVTFNKPVSAAGSPLLELETGATDRNATYAPGQSGGASLLFEYEVQGGDSSPDLDYTGTSALSLNGGTIRDQDGFDAMLTLPAQGAGLRTQGAIEVDGVAPMIANVTSPDGDDTYGTGTVVNITVGFTEPVEFDPLSTRPEISLDTGSGEHRHAVCEPASGFNAEMECTYTVREGDATADLGTAAGASLEIAGASARDEAGNRMADSAPLPASPAAATLNGSKDIALDTAVPEVLRVTSPNGTGPHDAGSEIHVHVVFDGTVTIDGDASATTLRLETGESNRFARYAGGSGTDTLEFVYTVIAGDFSPDLNYTGADALSLGTGRALVDEYGNRDRSDPALPDPGSPNSLGGQAAIEVRTLPTVVRVSADSTGTFLKVGETVGVRVEFSEKVWVDEAPGGGVPYVGLDTGRPSALGLANYSSGNGTHRLVFSYPVHPADSVGTLDYNGTGALEANGARVYGAGLNASLALPERGSSDSLASANIELRPNEAPTIRHLPNRTVGANVELRVDVSADDPEGQPITFSLAGAPPAGVAIDARTGLLTWTPSEAQRTAQGGANATYNITVRASDPHAASDTERFAVTVVESPPEGYEGPTVAAIADASAREGEEIRFVINVTAGHGPYVYSLADVDPLPPPGAAVDPANGTFTWTPDYDQNGTHSITARVADRFGLDGNRTFTVTVADAEPPGNEPPAIEPVDPQSAAEGERLEVRITADDDDMPIAYSLPGDPPDGAAIHPATGVFTWDIGYDAAGTHNITVSAADRYNRTSVLNFTVEVADREPPNLPPEIAPIPAQRATANTALELQVNATDPNDGDTLVFDLADPPPGAVITAGGLFTWTPGRGDVGTNTLNVTVTDDRGLSDWAPLVVAVVDLEAVNASAEAVFAGPRAVRIDYTAPLGAPAGHAGDLYGNVSISGGGSAEPASVSGLGTRTHIVRLGGDAADASQNGTIRLLASPEGLVNGTLYRFAGDAIPVGAGESARTFSPPGAASPVVAIETDGFVRALNATAAGDSARAAINVTGLAAGAINATLPADGRVAVIASFAEVSFPPGANATGVPADGLIELYVAARAPASQDIASAFGVDARDVLEVRRVVEAGDDAARIEFSMPVRILLVGQANGSAFYAAAGGAAVSPIGTACRADDTAAVHEQLDGSGECQIDSGGDKVIYTYHLTRFGTAVVDYGDTCSAALSKPEIAFGRIGAGGQSAAAAQEVRGTGTLPLDSVSVAASAWTGAGGAEVMPANATSARAAAGGDWTRLGGAAVDVPAGAGGRSAAVEFVVDVPQGALQAGARDAMVSQSVTYTVTCAAPPG